MRKIKIWFRAQLFDWPYWRVTYPDGKRTHCLHLEEAKGLRDIFKGKMWIDYTLKYDI